jgi:hypothetical protein
MVGLMRGPVQAVINGVRLVGRQVQHLGVSETATLGCIGSSLNACA